MKKTIFLMLLALSLCILQANAESFSTNITLNITGGNVTLFYEGGNVTYNESAYQTREIGITRSCPVQNTTCQGELGNISYELRQFNKDREAYYGYYTSCLANLSATSQSLKDCSDKPNYYSDLTSCQGNLTRVQADYTYAKSDRDGFQKDFNACLDAKGKDRDFIPGWIAIGFVPGVVAGFIFKRMRDRRPKEWAVDKEPQYYSGDE